jgi:type II secretory pathway pseudopilin PulG
MRDVAVVVVMGLVAATVATTFIQNSRARAELLEQSLAQQQAVTRRLDRLEGMLAASSDRRQVPPAVSQGAPSQPVAPRENAENEAGKPEAVSQTLPDRPQRIQAGSAIVDQAIQLGHWSNMDGATFAAATNGLTGEEREAILLRLTAAVNANQVRFDMRRPPQ